MRKQRRLYNLCIFLGIAGVMALLVIGVIICRYQHTSPERLPDLAEMEFTQIHSESDADQDGIDDQTDILQGALAYVNTKPKYKSKYYENGYPDDGYGVCTDVVAFAMKAAGYDLKALVEKDIKEHPDAYEIAQPDADIDFRRVKNLQIFFKNHARSLTTDVFQTEEWQGGDIVIFQKHIAIVSDRRNEKGIPYIIHHNDPWQKSYEQDILEKRDDIVGHYRWEP